MASKARPTRILASLTCILLTAACQEGVRIAVEQDADAVSFLASPVAKEFRACIRSVYVYPANAGDDARAIWHLERTDPEKCIARVRFGETPDGFAGDAPLQPLYSNRAYRVALMGVGFNEQSQFERQ